LDLKPSLILAQKSILPQKGFRVVLAGGFALAV
jgi:hypothetical protein